ncbi:TolC family protein [Ghiorsea bivora]|uniref:TolC family protein n=1 Tax=Ghiorsea bivora TaxID=1485545 RepID=UPI0005719F9E|nr:TolC family protein [Ghiorsea bivora]
MKKIIILSLCLLLPSPAFSAGVSSLQSAVDLALKHAPSLQAAQAARNALTEDITLGRASMLPYVVANASLTRRNQDFSYDVSFDFLKTGVRNNEQIYGIKAYQPLFDVEKWAAYQQGKISAATGEVKLAMQRQQTILEASAAWLSVIRAKAAFSAAKVREQAMNKLAMQAKSAFEVGTATVNDSLSASSRRDLATAGRIRAGQVLAQAEARLNSLVGMEMVVSGTLHQGMEPLHVKEDNLEIWEQRAEATALGVQLSDQAVAMADAEHLKSVGGAMPTLQLVAGWDHIKSSDGTFGGSTVKGASFGIELSMPLYAGGGIWAQQRKSTQEKIQAEFNMAEAKRTARLAARQSLLGLRTTAAEVKALDAALSSAKTEKKAAQAGFEVGVRTITDALDAEERLAAAKQRYADAVARHTMAYLQLIASTGELDESSVSIIDDFLKKKL